MQQSWCHLNSVHILFNVGLWTFPNVIEMCSSTVFIAFLYHVCIMEFVLQRKKNFKKGLSFLQFFLCQTNCIIQLNTEKKNLKKRTVLLVKVFFLCQTNSIIQTWYENALNTVLKHISIRFGNVHKPTLNIIWTKFKWHKCLSQYFNLVIFSPQLPLKYTLQHETQQQITARYVDVVQWSRRLTFTISTQIFNDFIISVFKYVLNSFLKVNVTCTLRYCTTIRAEITLDVEWM